MAVKIRALHGQSAQKFTWQVVGFFFVSGGRTFLSYGVYLVALTFASYVIAFTLSYGAGFVFSLKANTRYVFGSAITRQRILRYAVVYVASYLTALLLLTVAIRLLHIPAALAPLAVIPIMFPVNLFVERHALTT